jgi:drug/metabolite transporter (DMT)-like permease
VSSTTGATNGGCHGWHIDGVAGLPTRQQEQNQGFALAFVAAGAYASGPIWAAYAYQYDVSWSVVLTWRFTVAAAICWAIVAVVPGFRSQLRALDRHSVATLLGLGSLFVANAGTFYASLTLVPVTLAVVLSHLSPVIIFVLSRRFGEGLYGYRALIALGLATVGSLVSVGGVAGGASHLGVFLALASTIIYSGWAMLAARQGGERSGKRVAGVTALPATTIMFTGTAIGFIVWEGVAGRIGDVLTVPVSIWPTLVGFALVASIIGLQAWYAAARRIGVARTSIVTTVEPFIAMVLASAFLAEIITPLQLLGALLVLSAAFVLRSGATTSRSASGAA